MIEGILLYYKYVDLSNGRQAMHEWMKELCERLQLRGRVRVAYDGINVTVGGSWTALDQHIQEVKAHPLLQEGVPIDFKLAESSGPCSEETVRESKFNTLAVQLCKELVTLGPKAQGCADPWRGTATHLSPQEFHDMLHRAAAGEREAILLDTRNLYETSIGHFKVDGVPLLDPHTRCFSAFPDWVDTNLERLRSKRVMMYCTGGVRCERASAYVKSKGPAFQDVYQLQGGIQRYLEAFPDGGFFKGKNFVYDERQAVGSADPTVVGACTLCGSSTDDYGSRARCRQCRMLLLVCPQCQTKPPEQVKKHLVCRLCVEQSKSMKRGQNSTGAATAALEPADAATARKLRILCLHGFRQTAKQFQGRTCALRKKMKDIADFVFVDAPHTLPFYYKPREQPDNMPNGQDNSPLSSAPLSQPDHNKRAGASSSSLSSPTMDSHTLHDSPTSGTDMLDNVAECTATPLDGDGDDEAALPASTITNCHPRADDEQLSGFAANPDGQAPMPRPKRAWLLIPEQYNIQLAGSTNVPLSSKASGVDNRTAQQYSSSNDDGRSERLIQHGCHVLHGPTTAVDGTVATRCASHVPCDSVYADCKLQLLQQDAGFESKSGLEANSEMEAKSGLQPSSERESNSGLEANSETEAKSGLQPSSERESNSGLEANSETEAKSGLQPSSERESNSGLEANSEMEAKSGLQPNADSEANIETYKELEATTGLEPSAGEGHCVSKAHSGPYTAGPYTTLAGWQIAPEGLDEHQWERQVCGARESLLVLKKVLEQQGPFDGVLAFSQGCGMATALCALLQLQQTESKARYHHNKPHQTLPTDQETDHEPHGPCETEQFSHSQQMAAHESHPPDETEPPSNRQQVMDHESQSPDEAPLSHSQRVADHQSHSSLELDSPSHSSQGLNQLSTRDGVEEDVCCRISHPALKFAILSSGYLPAAPVLQKLIHDCGVVSMPSLHIHSGKGGSDHQVSGAESTALADVFEAERRSVMHHQQGHIIPSSKAFINAIRAFLEAVRAGDVTTDRAA